MNQLTNAAHTSGKYRCLSGSALKLIAMITMFIDHAGITLIAPWQGGWTPWFTYSILGKEGYYCLYQLFRDVGRLAFPIFGFLLVEGFLHTSDRGKYTRNLLLFALLSEIPFNLMLGNTLWFPFSQNIFFTLLIAFLCMWAMEYFTGNLPLQLVCAAAAIAAASFGQTDYRYNGIIFLIILYVFRYQPVNQTIFGCISLYFEWKACFAFIPIRCYNGKRGFIQGKRFKYLFYAFYPAHLLLLVLLRHVIYGI